MVLGLVDMSFIVLVQATLADIFVSCTISEGTSTVLGSDFLQPCVNLRRWFEHSLKQPEFSAVLGKSQLGAAVEKKEKASREAKPKKEAVPKESYERIAAPRGLATPSRPTAREPDTSVTG